MTPISCKGHLMPELQSRLEFGNLLDDPQVSAVNVDRIIVST